VDRVSLVGAAFEPRSRRPTDSKDQRIAALEQKLQRKQEVLSELIYATVAFHDRHPLEGYRRLAYMMLDADVVAVSPSRGGHERG
jgi:hypothetical protein